MDLKKKTTIVQAKTRAIRTKWTTEMAKDLSSFHSIDTDKELTSILRAESRKIKASRILGIK